MTRFIVENGASFQDKSILDIGSGCASASLAALNAGATRVVANDIDPFAGAALAINAALNGISLGNVEFSCENYISAPAEFFNQFDIVLCGDMLYDEDISGYLLDALEEHSCVYFGDPGRRFCPHSIPPDALLAEYPYQQDGFDSIRIFQLSKALAQQVREMEN